MEVVLLGSGSADGWPNPFCSCASCDGARAAGIIRGQTAALVDDTLLLDCGPEAPRSAARAGRALLGVRDVLLTHSHPDHIGPGALLWRSWAGRAEPLVVHGPVEALDACRPWVGPNDPVTFHEVAAGDCFVAGNYDVTALAATHGDAGSGPGLLWDVTDANGHRLLYATDTGWPTDSTLAALTAAAPYDLVLLEETFGDRGDLGGDHLDLDLFAALLVRLRAGGSVKASTEVVAVHLGHHNPAPAELDQRLAALGARAGTDGDVLTVGRARESVASRPRRTLVLGGARSGKSLRAERLFAGDAAVTYVATGGSRAGDEEWAIRVATHQARRPATWTTVETTDVAPLLALAGEGECILIDCLTLWLSDRLDRAGMWSDSQAPDGAARARAAVDADIAQLEEALRRTAARTVLVSNEVGQGVVPATRSGRAFRDELGRLNAIIAGVVDEVTLVVAGQPLTVKGPA